MAESFSRIHDEAVAVHLEYLGGSEGSLRVQRPHYKYEIVIKTTKHDYGFGKITDQDVDD